MVNCFGLIHLGLGFVKMAADVHHLKQKSRQRVFYFFALAVMNDLPLEQQMRKALNKTGHVTMDLPLIQQYRNRFRNTPGPIPEVFLYLPSEPEQEQILPPSDREAAAVVEDKNSLLAFVPTS